LAEPETPPGSDFIFSAYDDLSSSRAYQLGPIPWPAFKLYADHWGIAGNAFLILWATIAQMDIAQREWQAASKGKGK
jgi:hypothetical protein